MKVEQKAAIAKLQLAAAEALREGPQLIEALDTELVAQVRRAPRTAWVSPTLMGELTQGLFMLGGASLVQEVGCIAATSTADHPLFRPLVRGTLAIFGAGPVPLFRTLPRAWRLVNRNCGMLRSDVEAGRASVTVDELPPALDNIAFKESWVGTGRGILKLAGHKGEVGLATRPRGFRIDCTWP